MKRFLYLGFLVLIICILTPSVFADRSEKVKVFKFNKNYHDLIIERDGGERWLVQHNRQCGSMDIEFPITLIWNGEEISQLKVNFNEICKVYNFASYSGEARLTELYKSDNMLVADHLAEVIWKSKKYKIDYGSGCKNFRDFMNRRIYLSLPNDDLTGGQIILPGNRGQCEIKEANEVGVITVERPDTPAMLKGLDYQAQNNRVYFYWKHPENLEKPLLYLISHSRRKLNPEEYSWKEMPNLKRTKDNSYTVKSLINGRKYYFYLTAVNTENVAGPWIEISTAPVSSGKVTNNPDMEEFEIELEEGEDSYTLKWPQMENARRYFIRFYVNGKREFFKIIKSDINEFEIPKKEEYLNKRLRFTVRTIPKKRYSPRYFDGVSWRYMMGEEKKYNKRPHTDY